MRMSPVPVANQAHLLAPRLTVTANSAWWKCKRVSLYSPGWPWTCSNPSFCFCLSSADISIISHLAWVLILATSNLWLNGIGCNLECFAAVTTIHLQSHITLPNQNTILIRHNCSTLLSQFPMNTNLFCVCTLAYSRLYMYIDCMIPYLWYHMITKWLSFVIDLFHFSWCFPVSSML